MPVLCKLSFYGDNMVEHKCIVYLVPEIGGRKLKTGRKLKSQRNKDFYPLVAKIVSKYMYVQEKLL